MKLLRLLALLLVIGSAALLVSLRSIMAEGTMAPRHTRWTVTILVFVSIVAMLVISLQIRSGHYTRSWDHLKKQHADRATVFLEKYGLFFGLYVFGAGSIYLQAHYFISNVQCFQVYWNNEKYTNIINTTSLWYYLIKFGDATDAHHVYDNSRSEAVSNLVMTFTELIYFVLKIPFLSLCSRLGRPKRTTAINHAFLVIVGTDVAVWFYVFLRESNILETYADIHEHITINLNQTLNNACLTHSSLMQWEESTTLEHMLFPLSMEFALSSLEILIHVWLLEVSTDLTEPANDDDEDSHPLLGSFGALSQPHDDLMMIMQMNGFDVKQWKEQNPENERATSGFNRELSDDNQTVAILADGSVQNVHSQDASTSAEPSAGAVDAPAHGFVKPGTSKPYAGQNITPASQPPPPPPPPQPSQPPPPPPHGDEDDINFSGEWVVSVKQAFVPTKENRAELTRYESICMSMSKIFNIPVALVLGIIVFAIMQYYLLHSENGIPYKNNIYMTQSQFRFTVNLPAVLARVFCGGVPGLVASAYAVSIMITFHAKRPGGQGTKGSDVLLVLAVLGITFLSSFEVIIYHTINITMISFFVSSPMYKMTCFNKINSLKNGSTPNCKDVSFDILNFDIVYNWDICIHLNSYSVGIDNKRHLWTSDSDD